MPRVAISRVVDAAPETVARRLTPRKVIEAEGRYLVKDVSVEGDRTVVTVWPHGRILAPQYVFEDRPDGFTYRRHGEGRGVARTATTVTLHPEGDGTRIDVESAIERAFRVPVLDDAIELKRRHAVERLCGKFEAIVE